MKHRVGIIGYGPFGKALETWLEPYATFLGYNRSTHAQNLEVALQHPIIVLALPGQFLADFLVQNRDLLNPHALYIDVCSVKVEPVAAMLAHLPESAEIIATHPIFGPQSGKHGIAGLPIMVNPVRVSDEHYQFFLELLKKLELNIIESTPEEHDQEMAYVQGLTHYIGRAMQRIGIKSTPYATAAYNDLLEMKDIQGKDSDDIFRSIVHNNPYTKAVFQQFADAESKLDEQFDLTTKRH